MEDYSNIVGAIIKGQQSIIGPIALDQAKRVNGIQLSGSKVEISGNGKEVVGNLVNQYATLFGKASIEVCKDAVKEIKPPVSQEDLPDILK